MASEAQSTETSEDAETAAKVPFLPIEEYQAQMVDELFEASRELFALIIPESVLRLIAQLAALREDTDLLSWDEIEWIYQHVIPGDFLKEKIYDASSTGNKYDSYAFHDAVDEKGPTVFIIECGEGAALIGGFCNVSWWSPYKRDLEEKTGNCGWWVDGSTQCSLFVLRDEALASQIDKTLPLLAVNKTTDKKIMVAANQDGPNFGYNEWYVTSRGGVSAYNNSRQFESPVEQVLFAEFMKTGNSVSRMEVFTVDSFE